MQKTHKEPQKVTVLASLDHWSSIDRVLGTVSGTANEEDAQQNTKAPIIGFKQTAGMVIVMMVLIVIVLAMMIVMIVMTVMITMIAVVAVSNT